MLIRKLKTIVSSILNVKKPFKEKLYITQDKNLIKIKGLINNANYKVKRLYFKERESDLHFFVDSRFKKGKFEFTVDLFELNEELLREELVYDLFLEISVEEDKLTEEQANKIKQTAEVSIGENGRLIYSYQIRLGRFNETYFSKFDYATVGETDCLLYKTVQGNLSLAINKELKPSVKTQIDRLKTRNGMLKLKGKVFTRNSDVRNSYIVLRGRETNLEVKAPIPLTYLAKQTQNKYGLNRYSYSTTIDLNKALKAGRFSEDIYDVNMELICHDIHEPVRVRLGTPRFRARFNIKSTLAEYDNNAFSVNPYFTIKHMNLSLQIDSFEKESYLYMKKLMRWSWLLRKINKRKNVWLIGERPYKAQDTGYRLFEYIRKNHPEANVYYVIDRDSPELKNIEHLGNIVFYKSKEHIFKTLTATRILGSHHPDYLYPMRTDEFKRKVKAVKVFLQHGVMGTKNTTHFYSRNSQSFNTDLFLVSSEFEKQIIEKDFGYEPSEVVVTGLSRFDSLFRNDVPVKRQLLIIPTWREWLVNDEQFLESEYFANYFSLVNNPKLHELAEQYHFEIVFCLHPNMQSFSHYFYDSPVRVINQGEIDVQYLLKQSAMMITDYSSVAFDFSFLEKPILYYQFDKQRYIGKKGSHLDLERDLPGDIIYEEDTLIQLIDGYAKRNFLMSNENKNKASKFLTYKDKQSSERIFRATQKAKKRKIMHRILDHEVGKTLFNRFRKSKKYFPIMKLYYRIARKILTQDEDLILFESSLGRQYGDSPRYIYEEIIKRDLPYKKVWVSNDSSHFRDENTKVIKRLSPSYYYYLAKAKYWVNNQNFPTYIKKPAETIYLQTWHGTPLKKMLFDIDNIMGRSDDYLERVHSATKTWTYLISPSKYASNTFKSAFKYEGQILEVGYPRNDVFYKEERYNKAELVKTKLNIPQNKKVILYAPTFRDNQKTKGNRFSFDINMDLERLKEKLGDEYIILLRMHIVVGSKVKITEELADFVMNVSTYDEIQELYLISDILITDYSSVMFDFANTQKPILFYTYDLESYRDDIRGFYMDFEKEAPGPLMKTTDDILENILHINKVQQNYRRKYNEFYNKYCGLEDGKASKRVVDKVFDVIENDVE